MKLKMMLMPDTLPLPKAIADVQAVVRDSAHVLSRGNGTKTALAAVPDGVTPSGAAERAVLVPAPRGKTRTLSRTAAWTSAMLLG